MAKNFIRLPVRTVGRNVKSHSSRTEAGQFTAENVTVNEDPREGIKLTT
jgi:hypothetical protein